MTVVAASQFKLLRAKKNLEKAYKDGDIESVRRWDKEVAECLDVLFNDRDRDAHSLISQLESVLTMYSKIVEDLPDDAVTRIVELDR